MVLAVDGERDLLADAGGIPARRVEPETSRAFGRRTRSSGATICARGTHYSSGEILGGTVAMALGTTGDNYSECTYTRRRDNQPPHF